jgi:hypothetical protein
MSAFHQENAVKGIEGYEPFGTLWLTC